MSIDFGRSAHKYMTKLTKYTSYKNIVDDYQYYDKPHAYPKPNIFAKNVKIVSEAFDCAGLTDSQRREAHRYRFFALFHYAKHLGCFPNTVRYNLYGGYGMKVLGPTDPAWVDHSWNYSRFSTICDRLYLHALSELFDAQQIDPSYDLLADLDNDDRAICRMVQKKHVPQVFKIEEHSVPSLGIWRGDPEIWMSLTKAERVLLKLLRQQWDGVADWETVDEQELEGEYAELGITWHHDDNDGSLLLGP